MIELIKIKNLNLNKIIFHLSLKLNEITNN